MRVPGLSGFNKALNGTMVELRNRAVNETNAQNAEAAKQRSSRKADVEARLSSKVTHAKKVLRSPDPSPGSRGYIVTCDLSEENDEEE